MNYVLEHYACRHNYWPSWNSSAATRKWNDWTACVGAATGAGRLDWATAGREDAPAGRMESTAWRPVHGGGPVGTGDTATLLLRGAGKQVPRFPGGHISRLAFDSKSAGPASRGGPLEGPVILDEFPFLVTSSPELPSVLQHWIDQETVHAGLVVAIAGSSQRMMHGLVSTLRLRCTGGP